PGDLPGAERRTGLSPAPDDTTESAIPRRRPLTMARIHSSIAELVGGTPLVELTNYQKKHGISAHIIGKLEYLNPSGSVKDRLAVALIEDAKARGLISEGSTLIDVTSGNTGISLAAIGHAQGLEFIPYLEP